MYKRATSTSTLVALLLISVISILTSFEAEGVIPMDTWDGCKIIDDNNYQFAYHHTQNDCNDITALNFENYDLLSQLSISAGNGGVRGIATSTNNKYIYFGRISSYIEQFEIDNIHDLTSSTHLNSKFLFPNIGASVIRNFAFSEDGAKLFIVQHSSRAEIRQMNLTTPWMVESITGESEVVSISTNNTNLNSIRFNQNGTMLYALDNDTDEIDIYEMSIPWDILSLAYKRSIKLNYNKSLNLSDFHFSASGDFIYFLSQNETLLKFEAIGNWNLTELRYCDLDSKNTYGTNIDLIEGDSSFIRARNSLMYYHSVKNPNQCTDFPVTIKTFGTAFSLSDVDVDGFGMDGSGLGFDPDDKNHCDPNGSSFYRNISPIGETLEFISGCSSGPYLEFYLAYNGNETLTPVSNSNLLPPLISYNPESGEIIYGLNELMNFINQNANAGGGFPVKVLSIGITHDDIPLECINGNTKVNNVQVYFTFDNYHSSSHSFHINHEYGISTSTLYFGFESCDNIDFNSYSSLYPYHLKSSDTLFICHGSSVEIKAKGSGSQSYIQRYDWEHIPGLSNPMNIVEIPGSDTFLYSNII